jgi:RsiW-degrading membrane proteinase PrsW (M82 family)
MEQSSMRLLLSILITLAIAFALLTVVNYFIDTSSPGVAGTLFLGKNLHKRKPKGSIPWTIVILMILFMVIFGLLTGFIQKGLGSLFSTIGTTLFNIG